MSMRMRLRADGDEPTLPQADPAARPYTPESPQPDGPWGAVTPARTPVEGGRGRRWVGGLITLAGVGGMLGLFLAADAWPKHAYPLQEAALVWFLICGVVKLTLEGRRLRSARDRRSSRG